jgi:hypothetical protein
MCPCNVILEFSWLTFGIVSSSYTYVYLLIIEILIVQTLGFAKVLVSVIFISTSNYIPNSTRLVIVSLSIYESVLISYSTFSYCFFFTSFNFLICVIELWLWFLRWEISSIFFKRPLLNFFLIPWFFIDILPGIDILLLQVLIYQFL